MEPLLAGTVFVPGLVALAFLLVFAYLQRQSSERYFHSWQWFWFANTAYYALVAVADTHPKIPAYASLAHTAEICGAVALFVSARSFAKTEPPAWTKYLVLCALIYWTALHAIPPLRVMVRPYLHAWIAVLVVLLLATMEYARVAYQRDSAGLRWMTASTALWIVMQAGKEIPPSLLVGRYLHRGSEYLEIMPLLLLGTAMVVVLFDDERRAIQENALAFSSLDIDPTTPVTREQIQPSIESLLTRFMSLLRLEQAVLYVSEPWRGSVPSVARGFSPDFITRLEVQNAGDYLADIAFRRGGILSIHSLKELQGPMRSAAHPGLTSLVNTLKEENISRFSAVCLQTRERNMGVVIFPHGKRHAFSASRLRLLLSVSMQMGMTLENYLLVHDAHRRTKEFELLTQIGQVISSRLDPDEVLAAVHRELGRLFDTSNFYVAFLEGLELRYEFETVGAIRQPRRSRRSKNGLSDFVIRTGQPILIRSDMKRVSQRLGIEPSSHPAKCFIGVPIRIGAVSVGVVAALNFDREFVYEQRDVEVLATAAGQVAVAIENARMFAHEQRRARYLSFLNNVSQTAISSQNAEEMLSEIVGQIQKNFNYDHIGIGILDYATKEIEIKAEAGTTAHAKGKRVALGVGVLGRVARTGDTSLVQDTAATHLAGILPDSRSALCIPITYAEQLLGVLNIESRRENAFTEEDTLLLRTLADLLATALHNAFVFQKMQQQSITDALTGSKTRRYFLEALQSEWKRASRSTRPFSVVMIDLDKFKQVNDTMGHLEGDLVLARIARLLEQKCRQSNVVARFGGDEFVILMPETGVDQAQILAERLRLWIATDPMLSEHQITGSFGVATYPIHGSSVEDIMRVADAGMYVSKHAGGNKVATADEFIDGQNTSVQRQLISAYVEGFLQREHYGPEYTSELVSALKKFSENEAEGKREVMMDAILALNRASESRELFASGHGEQVARTAEIIARELGIGGQDIQDLIFAARIHDVGKIVVPEKILNKPAMLTEDEHYLVAMHANVGAEIIDAIPDAQHIRQMVRHHHEAFDGSGYPDGLKGEQIPLYARIISVAEAYVSMMVDRSYRAARSQADAVRELESRSGSQFDGMLVRILIRQFKAERAAQGND
ncbi:diguanylate cyclase with GAF sensor [Candidatus Koribacter versatilis Ellin345]|uniref:Diguanylate cyclase with GAF sensor n=1 Tax=Koribacter versatilis (strain Ellin345) TaxID=204669 RepID=Q1IVB0_KORVE|nr:diguanylate cyclase [Candidatus Koribacter versatilis]ABF39190.1 diguanylate cyclase with GAF sensor [Candidatus Koribacter versatilis Ellin345]